MRRNSSTGKWYSNLPRVFFHFLEEEISRRTFLETVSLSFKAKRLKFAQHETLSSLLERQAHIYPSKPFIYFEKKCYTFKTVDRKTNQFASYLDSLGLKGGDGIGIMLENCPEYLYTYYASQRLGMYAVPINTALLGEGLLYLINHSNIRILIIDEKYLKAIKSILKHLIKIETVFVKRDRDCKNKLKAPFKSLDVFYQSPSIRKLKWKPKPNDISTIMYTSGTTGKPKGVIYYHRSEWIRKAGLLNHLIYNNRDIIYTCLPLFHVNALFLSFSASLWLGIPLVLSKRFSASKFWDEINEYGATVFNAIGAMIPILLKAPKTDHDKDNSIRLVLSAACPASCWREFEQRFGLRIWEGYAAVDGGQNFIFNLGNAPVGSIGKMSLGKYRVVNEDGQDVGVNEPGELVFITGKDKKTLEYFKNKKATAEKLNGECLHTGDLVYKDKKGYLYFVGRKTESMRRRGENVSAYEVENVIIKNKNILECAVFGVPSELAEEDIMCVLAPVNGKKIDPFALKNWLSDKLARYAIPRYVRIINELPKTSTHRVIKQPLIDTGVTTDTFDLEG